MVNKSYDTILEDGVILPQINPKKNVKHTLKHQTTLPNKVNTADLSKENEDLKAKNKELSERIKELERVQSLMKDDVKTAKLLFEYERKMSALELGMKSAQIKLVENDKLITQLLQTIDYLNQSSKGTLKKPPKAETKKGQTNEKNDNENEGQFLFDKSELVQSHTQIKQTKYMIFEGFKVLQEEVTKKYGDQGRVIGTVDYLLGNLDALFNIIHQLEIKELQYLNLLANNQPNENKGGDKAKPNPISKK